MNYLAHAYLSGNDPELMVGNFIADAVKGKKINAYDNGIRNGMILHRAIDEFTDSHAIVKKSCRRLSTKYRHYSGVIVDIFYDHFLASKWHMHHDSSIEEYTKYVYDTVVAHNEILPEKIQHMLKYMIPQNWLLNYRSFEGIDQVLKGMSRRTTFESGMEHAIDDLKSGYSEFEGEFDAFFPDVCNFAKNYISELT